MAAYLACSFLLNSWNSTRLQVKIHFFAYSLLGILSYLNTIGTVPLSHHPPITSNRITKYWIPGKNML